MTQTEQRGRGSRAPLVVARRWDQLGARLNAIVNARCLADRFGLEFRFVWPRGADEIINDPGQLFSEAFLADFEIEGDDLANRTPIADRELIALDESSAIARLERAGVDSFVEIHEVFEILLTPSDTADAAQAAFVRCFSEIGWRTEVADLIAACSTLEGVGTMAAVHVRAGDIVDGDWRHLIAHEKYTPTPYVEYAIQQLSDAGHGQVVVLSDNDRYLNWLRTRFTTVITAAELVPGYAALTEVQRALADILVLANCELIVGPPSSAFSRLGANLGCRRVTRADELLPAGTECEMLRRGIDRRRADVEREDFWNALLSRDICWCLDVFADELSARERCALAAQAVDLDPEFAAAQARLARTSILAGDSEAALGAAAQALKLAGSVTRHPDPMVEALATDIAVRYLAVAMGRLPPTSLMDARMRWLWRYERIAAGRRRRIESCLTDLAPALSALGLLTPYQVDAAPIAANLRRLTSAIERLSTADGAALAHTARALDRPRVEGPDVHSLRVAGLEQHRATGSMEPVSRDLEKMAELLEGAVAAT